MERSINTIWSELNSHLEAFVWKKVADKDAAKDIVQDVFIKVQSKINTLKDENKVTSWIFQITRNAIADYYRNLQRSNLEDSETEVLEALEANEAPMIEEKMEFSQCIQPMINAMPEKYREALTLSEIEGLSQKELAERLNISYSGAKSRVQRGRILLKEMLLQCCDIQTDKYGNVIDYQVRGCGDDCD